MTVAEDQRVAVDLAQAGDHAVEAVGDVGGRLAARRRMGPHGPARYGAPDLLGGDALVVAVGPLDEVGVHLGVAVPGERGRVTGPTSRAGEHECEVAFEH